ncbi:MAG: sulfotransferase family protein [Neomegalonema sp.]|nr:sulfotransferase family protein [Neomegalonema sp.]
MPLFQVSHKLFHFVHIPKTGGTSIESFVEKVGKIALLGANAPHLPCSPQHFHAEIHQALGLDAIASDSFALIRDPLQRMVSEYKMRLTHALLRRKHDRNYIPPHTRIADLPQGATERFDSWVPHILKRYRQDPFVCDNHIRPQQEFLTQHTVRLRFEQGLQQAHHRIAALADLQSPPPLPHENAAARFKVAASRETVRRIVDFYDADYEALGYARPADDGFETSGPELALQPPPLWRSAWSALRQTAG